MSREGSSFFYRFDSSPLSIATARLSRPCDR